MVARVTGGDEDDPVLGTMPTIPPLTIPVPVPTIKAPAPIRSVVGTVASALPTITIKDGTVKVGIDVPAGTYVASVAPLACTWKILNGGLLGVIVGLSNGLGGKQTVHLQNGQTFTNRGCAGFLTQ